MQERHRASETKKKDLEKSLVDKILQSGKRKDEELNKILFAIDEVDQNLPGPGAGGTGGK